MRPLKGALVPFVLCLLLWGVLLWRGQPWPLHVTLGLGQAGAPAPPAQAPHAPVPRPGPVTLTPRAGTAMAHRTLPPCPGLRLHAVVTHPFGARRGLEALALGWPGREDGWGVLAPQSPATPPDRGPGQAFDLTGQGRVPGPELQLTSLGGLFDGAGTLEVRCDD